MALPPLEARITADTSDYDAGFDKAQAKLGGLERGFRRAGTQATGLSRNLDGASGSTANLAAQFNDIGVMLAAGQSPLLLAVQQGTQVNQVLGQMGGTGAQRMRALGTAFMSIISPANLMTLGVIAGGAALVQWGMGALSAGDEAKNLEDRMSDLKSMSDGLSGTMDILLMDIHELRQVYGEAATAVQQFALAQAEIRASQAEARLRDQLVMVEKLTQQYSRFASAGRDGKNAMDDLMRDFGVARDEAIQLGNALANLDAAETFEQQQTALGEVLRLLEEMEVPLGSIPEDLQAAIDEMITLGRETEAARVLMEKLRAASAGMTTGVGLSPSDPNLLPPTRDGGGGGRSGGGARVNPLIGQIEQLEESLMTQEEMQFASYQKQQEMLQQALEQQLLTRAEYADLMEKAQHQHASKLAQIDAYRHGTTLQKTDQFLGEMASAFANGNDQMLRVARAFGAAQALIGALTGAAEALKLPFPANLAAAAKVLATGMGFVSAIKGVTAGGGGGAGGGAAGGASAGAAASSPQAAGAAPIPLQVSAQFQGDYFTRDQVSNGISGLFDQLSDEASRRGLNLTVVA